MRKEEWIAEKAETVLKDEWETVNKAAALWTRAKSDITDARVPGVLQADRVRQRPAAGLHPQPRRRSHRVHATALHPGQGAVRPVESRQARRREAVRQARLHHGRRRGADAGLPALRQGRDRLADLPLNVSRELLQESRDVKTIREGATKRVLSMLEDLAENQKDKYAAFWKEFGAGDQGRASAKTTPTTSGWPSCCASRRPTPTRACPSPTTCRA